MNRGSAKTTPSKAKLAPGVLLGCFFLSGLTGLAYEILWVRLLEQVIGGAPFAVAIVLAVFMGGLGLGSYLASRWIDRATSPAVFVRWYGIFELGIGIYALTVPTLLYSLQPWYAWLYSACFNHFVLFNVATTAFCGVVLLVPTMLMGATLPLLCRYAISSLDEVGTRTGLFYGLNTLGAATGAFVTGMVWLPKYGMTGTLMMSVFINCGVGGLCLFLARGKKLATVHPVETPKKSKIAAHHPATALVLAIFVVSGFSSLAYEVIWTRLLSLIIGPTTYSFTIVLVTFISGLALGSVLFGRWADRVARPERLLLWTQLGAAASVLLGSQFLGGSQLFFAKLLYAYKDSFAGQQGMKALALFAVMIWPTLCLGAAFPLVAKILARSTDKVGRTLGMSYAWNTVGCVAGSLAAGFAIIPFVGMEHGLSLVAGIQMTVILTGGWWCLRDQARQRLSLAFASVMGLGLCLMTPRWNHLHLASSKYHRLQDFRSLFVRYDWLDAAFRGRELLGQFNNGKLLFYGEGVGGFTTVLEYHDVYGNPTLSLANSGKFDASTDEDMKTQVLLAHIPMLFHPNPEQVMVLGLGSGITAGEVLNYPSVTRLDILEFNEQVAKASRLFTNYNNHVLADPRTSLIVQDVRAHLSLSSRSYDVIISEPSNPWMAGMASLFTEDFFRLAHSRLRPGGIYIQFLHSYEIDWPSFSLVVRTFNKVFPGAILMTSDPGRAGSDYLLVGYADGPAQLDIRTARTKGEPLRRTQNMVLSDPSLLYRMIVSEDLDGFAGPGRLNTEDRPTLEFNAPRSLYAVDETLPEKIEAAGRILPNSQRVVDKLTGDVEGQLAYAEFALSLGAPFAGMVDEQRASEKQKRRLEGMVATYCQHHPMDSAVFANTVLAEAGFNSQIAVLAPRKASLDAKSLAYLANLYFQSGSKTQAYETFTATLALDKDNVRALNALGVMLSDQKKFDEAIRMFERVVELNPFQVEAQLNLGVTYLDMGDKVLARACFKRALELDPVSEQARDGLAIASGR